MLVRLLLLNSFERFESRLVNVQDIIPRESVLPFKAEEPVVRRFRGPCLGQLCVYVKHSEEKFSRFAKSLIW